MSGTTRKARVPWATVDPSGRVPPFVHGCIEYLDNFLAEVGLFRLSGTTSDIRAIKEAWSSGKAVDLSDVVDPHVVTGLLKSYLREMPEPLFPYALNPTLLQCNREVDESQKIKEVAKVLRQLPAPSLAIACDVVRHLSRVALHSAENKMHSTNLACVFAPTIMRSKTLQAMLSDNEGLSSVLAFMIDNCEKLFPEPPPLPSPSSSPRCPPHEDAAAGGDERADSWRKTSRSKRVAHTTVEERISHRNRCCVCNKGFRGIVPKGLTCRCGMQAHRSCKLEGYCPGPSAPDSQPELSASRSQVMSAPSPPAPAPVGSVSPHTSMPEIVPFPAPVRARPVKQRSRRCPDPTPLEDTRAALDRVAALVEQYGELADDFGGLREQLELVAYMLGSKQLDETAEKLAASAASDCTSFVDLVASDKRRLKRSSSASRSSKARPLAKEHVETMLRIRKSLNGVVRRLGDLPVKKETSGDRKKHLQLLTNEDAREFWTESFGVEREEVSNAAFCAALQQHLSRGGEELTTDHWAKVRELLDSDRSGTVSVYEVERFGTDAGVSFFDRIRLLRSPRHYLQLITEDSARAFWARFVTGKECSWEHFAQAVTKLFKEAGEALPTAEELAGLKEEIDTDHSNSVSVYEIDLFTADEPLFPRLRSCMRGKPPPPPSAVIEDEETREFWDMHFEHMAECTYDEFVHAATWHLVHKRRKSPPSLERMDKVMRLLDTDRSWTIDASEVQALSRAWGMPFFDLLDVLSFGDSGDEPAKASPPPTPQAAELVVHKAPPQSPSPQQQQQPLHKRLQSVQELRAHKLEHMRSHSGVLMSAKKRRSPKPLPPALSAADYVVMWIGKEEPPKLGCSEYSVAEVHIRDLQHLEKWLAEYGSGAVAQSKLRFAPMCSTLAEDDELLHVIAEVQEWGRSCVALIYLGVYCASEEIAARHNTPALGIFTVATVADLKRLLAI
eukprot:m51a1_g5088 putative domain-containing protein (956) ;mRNA; f:258437-262210